MRHYLFLGAAHLVEKYVRRGYDPAEVERGWHGWRARVKPESVHLPSARDLRRVGPHGELDASAPRATHWLAEVSPLS